MTNTERIAKLERRIALLEMQWQFLLDCLGVISAHPKLQDPQVVQQALESLQAKIAASLSRLDQPPQHTHRSRPARQRNR